MDDVTRNPPPLRSGTQRGRPLSTVTALAPGEAADPCQSNQNSNARTRQPPRDLSTVTTDLGVGKQHVICLAVDRLDLPRRAHVSVGRVQLRRLAGDPGVPSRAHHDRARREASSPRPRIAPRFPTRHQNYALVSHVSERVDRAKSTALSRRSACRKCCLVVRARGAATTPGGVFGVLMSLDRAVAALAGSLKPNRTPVRTSWSRSRW